MMKNQVQEAKLKWRHSRSNGSIEPSREQIVGMTRLSRADNILPKILRAGYWPATQKAKETSSKWPTYTQRGSGRRLVGKEACSRMSNLDQVDGKELHICLISVWSQSPSILHFKSPASRQLSRKETLFMKISILKRIPKTTRAVHCLEYNHDSK